MPEILHAQLEELVTSGQAAITDVTHLASYNWIEATTPTIFVPGIPARWNAPETPKQLNKDSGHIYIAQNAARHPDSPLEPLFRSLYAENDSFDIGSANIITDRNNIRKLLSFVSPELSEYPPEEFTINIEVVNNTAILCRDETATHVFLGPADFRGFGHEFEKAYTVSEVTGSTGHHRVISYQFCGLALILRYETDAYMGGSTSSNPGEPEGGSISPGGPTGGSSFPGSRLIMRRGGRPVPLGSIIKIKTRTMGRRLDFRSLAEQLWASQTPNLVRAYHDKGKFYDPQIDNVTAQIQQWEAANQSGLRKLAWLMKRIPAMAKDCGGKATIKYDAQGDKLVISQDSSGRKMLPADLYTKWDTGAPCAESETLATVAAAVQGAIADPVKEGNGAAGAKRNDNSAIAGGG